MYHFTYLFIFFANLGLGMGTENRYFFGPCTYGDHTCHFSQTRMARISILPKISRFWLCLCVVYDIGSLCFQNALEVL